MESKTRIAQSAGNSFIVSGYFTEKNTHEKLGITTAKFEFFLKSDDQGDVYASVPCIVSNELIEEVSASISMEHPVIAMGWIDTEDRYKNMLVINEIVSLVGQSADPKVNRFNLAGRIGGNQPNGDSPFDFRVFESGHSITKFSLAVRKGRETCWIPCEAWDKTGVILVDYAQKGTSVALFGRLKYEEWESADGYRYKLLINAQSVVLLGNSNSNGNGNAETKEEPATAPKPARRRLGKKDDAAVAAANLAAATNGTIIDDLPF